MVNKKFKISISKIIWLTLLFIAVAFPSFVFAHDLDIQTVDSEGYVGDGSTIAADRSDNPHVSYYNYTNEELDYTKGSGAAQNPTISSLYPDSGPVGIAVIIYGSNFGTSQGRVTFNGTDASILSWSETQIKTSVPSEATTGPIVVHTSGGVDSNGVTFILGEDAASSVYLSSPTAQQKIMANISPAQDRIFNSQNNFYLEAEFNIALDLTGTACSFGMAGDIDGDGIPELIMSLYDRTNSCNHENSNLVVAKYRQSSLETLYEQSGYEASCVVDYDDDDKEEILSWFDFALGYNEGIIQSEELEWPWSFYPPSLEDIDNDGITELITTCQMDNSLRIYTWNGSQLILEKIISDINGHEFWSPARTGDIDNDGKTEIVATLLDYYDYEEKRYHWLIVALEYQDGEYIAQVSQMFDGFVSNIVDYDNDGNLEIAWTEPLDGSIHAAQYDSNTNSFQEEWSFVFGYYSGMGNMPNFTVGDADNDGDNDVLVGLGGHCEIPEVGPGLYIFGYGKIMNTAHPYGVFSVQVGDFDGDQINEIAVWTYDNKLQIWSMPHDSCPENQFTLLEIVGGFVSAIDLIMIHASSAYPGISMPIITPEQVFKMFGNENICAKNPAICIGLISQTSTSALSGKINSTMQNNAEGSVDLQITDSSGRVISKNTNTNIGSLYGKSNLGSNELMFNFVFIGNEDNKYTIKVIPTENSNPDDEYSLFIRNISNEQTFDVTIKEKVGNSIKEYEVELTLDSIITLNRAYMNFGATSSADKTPEQSFAISNLGGGVLDWTVTDDAAWLSCSPTSGTGTAAVAVSVDASGLSTGTYNGTITITDPNASNSPQTVSVTLNVYAAGSDAVPFGSFDTPIDQSTVMSSVPVTGWALDDIGVESLKIYRDPVSGEGGNQIYIGDAIFVEGARPDVESLYPDYPLNYQAGWGYMLLTNFMPNQGTGTFTLHAVAKDTSGHEVTLGSKTITCDNASAVKPFGAIDTPSQGGTASGTAFVNFGWALTPLPNSIPIDGSTINVYVDGVNLGNPAYNNYRADIATLFPGYANSDGAVGFYTLDTTDYANGVHTIVWSVADNVGNADGIGSRYFSIFNGSSGEKAQAQALGQNVGFSPNIGFDKIKSIMPRFQPIKTKTGYNMEALPKDIYPDEDGVFNVEIKEVERLIISLNPYPLIQDVYSGYLVIGSELRPLPIGSYLDPYTGIFSWQPGPGFIGEYQLVFVKGDSSAAKQKIKIKVNIKPKFGIK